eukprot:TRINITY_DN14228_c0_g1_i1.p1 TRINITY_DN14228_c0_g1~~TRINITY_DN14228_c0_g1_i1.p1  ORF type:complete len:118 (-),score=3.26 TRINITY_DN14228_c0_g1_i1:214-567(-)
MRWGSIMANCPCEDRSHVNYVGSVVKGMDFSTSYRSHEVKQGNFLVGAAGDETMSRFSLDNENAGKVFACFHRNPKMMPIGPGIDERVRGVEAESHGNIVSLLWAVLFCIELSSDVR